MHITMPFPSTDFFLSSHKYFMDDTSAIIAHDAKPWYSTSSGCMSCNELYSFSSPRNDCMSMPSFLPCLMNSGCLAILYNSTSGVMNSYLLLSDCIMHISRAILSLVEQISGSIFNMSYIMMPLLSLIIVDSHCVLQVSYSKQPSSQLYP